MSDRGGDDSDDESKTPHAGRSEDETGSLCLGDRDVPSVGEATRARSAVLSALFPGETRVLDGRYELGSMIGSGGLGRVYKALDTKLGRHVAVKFLKGAAQDPELAKALEGEARVLARLQHPNIVAVHDVGRSEDELYLTMELIDGVSLETWLRTKRSWREVVDVMRQAALGLSAAHEAGVVHRDFKPANVMLDRTGRVRVVDFGLAREVVWTEDSVPSGGDGTLHTKAAGTPPYMAPEQFEGEVSAASDQFAFCTTLYEGLCGKRPWTGRERGVREVGARQDPRLRSLRGVGLPARPSRAVLRGLSFRPEDRFASVAELVAMLEPSRRRPMAWAVTGLAVASVTLGWITSEPAPCSERGVAASLAVPEAHELLDALGDDGGGQVAFQNAATDWNKLDAETCEAHSAGRLSSTLYELRTHCLDRTLRVVNSAISIVSAGEFPPARGRAALLEAMQVDRCRDDEGLLLGAAEPGYDIEAGSRIQREIDEAHVFMTLGDDETWLTTLLEIEASISDRSKVLPDALWLATQLGDALLRAGRLDDADEVLMPALLEAKAHPRWARTVAMLQIQLATLAQLRGDYERAELLIALAEPTLRSLSEKQFLLKSVVLRASVAQSAGRGEDALLCADRAEKMFTSFEDSVPFWAGSQMLRADVEGVRCAQSLPAGRSSEALAACARALDIYGEEGIDEGRARASVEHNYAVALTRAGRLLEAAAMYERVALSRKAAGQVRAAASTQMNRANVLDRLGRYQDAMAAYAEAETLVGAARGELWVKLQFNRSLAHASNEHWEAAAIDAQKALQRARELEQIPTRRIYDYEVAVGIAELACGRIAMGRAVLERALRHEMPDYDPYSKAELRIALAPHADSRTRAELREEALNAAEESGSLELTRQAQRVFTEDTSR